MRNLARLLGEHGRTLEAVEKLCALREAVSDTSSILDDIRAQMPAAMARFNAHVAANEIEQAEKYAGALAELVPGNVAFLNSALPCNLALKREEPAKRYATAEELAEANPAQQAELRQHLESRRQRRVNRTRFRRDPHAFLQQLEEKLLQPALPS